MKFELVRWSGVSNLDADETEQMMLMKEEQNPDNILLN
jgi:hypothetical protein